MTTSILNGGASRSTPAARRAAATPDPAVRHLRARDQRPIPAHHPERDLPADVARYRSSGPTRSRSRCTPPGAPACLAPSGTRCATGWWCRSGTRAGVAEQRAEVVGGRENGVGGVVDVPPSVAVAVDAVGSHVEGGPSRVLNCIGPAQQPYELTPERRPGALERPWSVSIEPIPASTCPGTRTRGPPAWSARYGAGMLCSARALGGLCPGPRAGALADQHGDDRDHRRDEQQQRGASDCADREAAGRLDDARGHLGLRVADARHDPARATALRV